MKINEVFPSLKLYMATVRVLVQSNSTTARTTVSAESATQAIAMLTRIFGAGNVFSVSQIFQESSRADQIQAEAAIRPQTVHRRAQPRKIALIQPSPVQQPQEQPQRRPVSARPVAASLKHQRVQNKLTKQFMRQSNMIKPTATDMHIARDRADTLSKRAELEYQKHAGELMRRHDARQDAGKH